MFDEIFVKYELFLYLSLPSIARPGSGISHEPRPYSGRYLGRSGSPRFGQNSVGPLNRLRTESGSSAERSPSSAKIPSVEVRVVTWQCRF